MSPTTSDTTTGTSDLPTRTPGNDPIGTYVSESLSFARTRMFRVLRLQRRNAIIGLSFETFFLVFPLAGIACSVYGMLAGELPPTYALGGMGLSVVLLAYTVSYIGQQWQNLRAVVRKLRDL